MKRLDLLTYSLGASPPRRDRISSQSGRGNRPRRRTGGSCMTRATVHRHHNRLRRRPPLDAAGRGRRLLRLAQVHGRQCCHALVAGRGLGCRQRFGLDVLPDTPASAGISLTGAEVALDWAALVGLFDGYDSQILQISTLNAAGRALTRDVYSLPPPTSSQRQHRRCPGAPGFEIAFGIAPGSRVDERWPNQGHGPQRHLS